MATDYQLVLIDGSSYLFRAYHALPQLISSKGQPTGAIKGVISMVKKLMSDYPESQFAVVFDAKGKSFRNEIYADYKANRPAMPDELRSQIAPIHKIIQLMGLPLLIVEGVEADDVIGTLAVQATKKKMDVLISTGDKDMAQLVSPHVTLINTMNNSIMNEVGVFEKFGVRSDQIIDYLALVGDSADNIPGVPKCGPKTAAKWLGQYENLNGVIDHSEDIGGKVGESLRDSIDFLSISYDLATIKTDVLLAYSVDELKLGEVSTEHLLEIFTELEFKPWVTELGADLIEVSSVSQRNSDLMRDYDLVLTESDLDAWIKKLSVAEAFAFDTETTSVDYMLAELVGISFCCEAGVAAYVPLAHDYSGAPVQLDLQLVLDKLKPLLGDPAKTVIGQNLKYDISVLAKYDVQLNAKIFDTMLESYVLNSVASRHNMDDLALKYLGETTIRFEDIAGKGVKQLTFNQIELDKAAPYAAEDADITFRLHQTLLAKLEEGDARLSSVLSEIELPLVNILSRIERTGVLLDKDKLGIQSRELEKRLAELEQEAFGLAGEEFNLGSTKQLQQIFFEKLGLPVLKKTPKGQPSTAEPVLQELAIDYPLPRVIMDYRGLSKLKSTYTDQLPKQIVETSGRIHTSYHQAVTATGRLSSSEPNLQNIPIRTAEGRRVRRAFVAPSGRKILAADYSQIELRIMAHLSQDKGLLQAFQEGRDIHTATASEVFGNSIDSVSDEQRRNAKAINFGLIYGMSAFGLSRQLNIARGDAQDYIDLYFERYPGVKDYMEKTRTLASEQGYVETIYGRRLYLPEINASNFQRRQAAERTAINAPMQGSAADIIKRAMIKVDDWLTETELDAKMTMQVHDELVLEVADHNLVDTAKGIEKLMCAAADLSVPLVVEVGTGENWEEAH